MRVVASCLVVAVCAFAGCRSTPPRQARSTPTRLAGRAPPADALAEPSAPSAPGSSWSVSSPPAAAPREPWLQEVDARHAEQRYYLGELRKKAVFANDPEQRSWEVLLRRADERMQAFEGLWTEVRAGGVATRRDRREEVDASLRELEAAVAVLRSTYKSDEAEVFYR